MTETPITTAAEPARPELHRLMKFDVIARCAIMIYSAFTCTLAWFVPTSLTAKIIAQGGGYGYVVLIAFSTIIAIGFVDICINDILPDCYSFRSVKVRRHKLYHYVATLYFIQAMVAVGDRIDVEDFVAAFYFLIGVVAAWYSWAAACRGEHV